MITQERKDYISNSKALIRKEFEKNQVMLCYVRKRKSFGRTGCNPEQVKAIKKFLNLAGPDVSPANAIKIIDNALPDELKLGEEGVEGYKAVRKNWLARKSPILGVVIAIKTEAGVKIGWSLCNDKDQFNRYIGVRKAIRNSMDISSVQRKLADSKREQGKEKLADYKTNDGWRKIPHTVTQSVQNMIERVTNRK